MGTQSREGLTMVHILTSVTLVLVSLELSLSAPFLLDLLPNIQIARREGKAAVDSGYGAPESSAYEAPKPSYSTTTTVRPCSYEAPTTTSAPTYGAPEQKKAGFPDILGFIGGILKPKKAPESNTGYGCLSPPVEDSYGAPQTDAYEAPQSDAYEALQSDAYEAPQSDAYEAPQSDTYEAPGIAVNERSNVPSS